MVTADSLIGGDAPGLEIPLYCLPHSTLKVGRKEGKEGDALEDGRLNHSFGYWVGIALWSRCHNPRWVRLLLIIAYL